MDAQLKTRLAPTSAEAALEAEIAAMIARAPDAERAAAGKAFAKMGLPTRRLESWHYSDLRGALKTVGPAVPAPDDPTLGAAMKTLGALTPIGGARLVSVDGTFIERLSDPPPREAHVGAGGADGAMRPAEDAMFAAATALAADPLAITIGKSDRGTTLEVVHLSSGRPGVSAVRLSVAVKPGAKATVIERFVGASPERQRLARVDAHVAAGASLTHVVTVEDGAGLHVESLTPLLGVGARYHGFALVTGGAFVRRQIFARLAGEDGKIALGGLSLIDGGRHADTTLEVTHAAPGGESREFYKHIVADKGVGVFQGKVIVEQRAQKTDGGMKSQAVLLSSAAQMMNKPELEIFADDVVCGHGATVSALDSEQIFYLQARGIKRPDAEAMVLEAFGAEAVLRLADESLHEPLLAMMRAWLAKRGKGGAP